MDGRIDPSKYTGTVQKSAPHRAVQFGAGYFLSRSVPETFPIRHCCFPSIPASGFHLPRLLNGLTLSPAETMKPKLAGRTKTGQQAGKLSAESQTLRQFFSPTVWSQENESVPSALPLLPPLLSGLLFYERGAGRRLCESYLKFRHPRPPLRRRHVRAAAERVIGTPCPTADRTHRLNCPCHRPLLAVKYWV